MYIHIFWIWFLGVSKIKLIANLNEITPRSHGIEPNHYILSMPFDFVSLSLQTRNLMKQFSRKIVREHRTRISDENVKYEMRNEN